MKQFALPKSRHLCSHIATTTLFKEGKAFLAYPIRIVYTSKTLTPHRPQARCMFVAPKKLYKHAVDRNHFKRLMREAYRLQQNKLIEVLDEKNLQIDISFGAISATMPEYYKVNKAINKAINTIIKQIECDNLENQ